MTIKNWFRIQPETPPLQAEGIAPRNVGRATQGMVLLAALGCMGLCRYVLIPQGIRWLQAASDACEALERLRIFFSPFLLVPLALLFFVALDGLRSLQYRQWPWPGMWLWKDTPIRSAGYALWRGRLELLLGVPVSLGLLGYMVWLLLFGQMLRPEVHAQCQALMSSNP